MKVMTSKAYPLATGALLCLLGIQQAQAAIALDRTRVVFNGAEKSVSLNISNENKQLPYLAQGWIEDAQGTKITNPMTVLPPVQRLEPGAKSQVKIQGVATQLLAQDRETLFYFNLREIPPKSDKPNTLQLALQTRIKLFYRPKAIAVTTDMTPWQEQLTLTKQEGKYQVNNPTAYYVTIVDGSRNAKSEGMKEFEPLMIAPKSSGMLNVGVAGLGNSPVLTYINDYGGRPQLQFACSGSACKATPIKAN